MFGRDCFIWCGMYSDVDHEELSRRETRQLDADEENWFDGDDDDEGV